MTVPTYSAVKNFWTAVIIGFVYSAVFYGGGAAGLHPGLVIAAVALKLGAGIYMCFFREWRAVGAGLITSVPIAVMIVLTICFAIAAVLS